MTFHIKAATGVDVGMVLGNAAKYKQGISSRSGPEIHNVLYLNGFGGRPRAWG